MTTREGEAWISLPMPLDVSVSERRRFMKLARLLAAAAEPEDCLAIVRALPSTGDRATHAAVSVLGDLLVQGWDIRIGRGRIEVRPASSDGDPSLEKTRVRRQELWKRDEQLRTGSVRRFILGMEKPRPYDGRFVSIFDLMRDGEDLALQLRRLREAHRTDSQALSEVIDPYVLIVDPASRCTFTGLRLLDIWRYFRHTWVNQYSTTPGRTMMLLVRDRAAAHHPVIGIAAVASPIVQISERDEWIGWQSEQFVESMRCRPSIEHARWLMSRLDQSLAELYLEDLIGDGLYWPSLWNDPDQEAITRLRKESDSRRRDHARFVRPSSHKGPATNDDHWVVRAETDLFRSKRTGVLADLLTARSVLLPFLGESPTRAGLADALSDAPARRAISSVVRRAKGEGVGTEIADLSVCGSVAPYNALLGGKLVSMLSVSPTVIRAYGAKYGSTPSEIASSMAGRPIHRRSNLVYVGTTSLYGSGSSQYNRIRIPEGVLAGSSASVEYKKLGRSKSYGTSHLSSSSMAALESLAQRRRTGRRVNSIFGEGVNPKLRKVREGIDLIGWPSDALMRHGRERLVYGVPLVSNLLPYLLGMQKRPQYVFDVKDTTDGERIARYWSDRWLSGRLANDDVLDQVASNTVVRPVSHGARVPLPAEIAEGTN